MAIRIFLFIYMLDIQSCSSIGEIEIIMSCIIVHSHAETSNYF